MNKQKYKECLAGLYKTQSLLKDYELELNITKSQNSHQTEYINFLKEKINELQLHEQCYEVNIEGYHEEMRDKIHQETDKIIQEHTSDIDLPF